MALQIKDNAVDTLKALCDLYQETGKSPTLRALGKRSGYSGVCCFNHLRALAEQGLIERIGNQRWERFVPLYRGPSDRTTLEAWVALQLASNRLAGRPELLERIEQMKAELAEVVA